MPRSLLLLLAVSLLSAADLDEADLERRILALRQVDAVVPAPAGATGTVRYRLERHAFPFGTAIDGACLGFPRRKGDGTLTKAFPVDDQRHYQEILRQHFTATVACNEMKWYTMEAQDGVAQDDPALGMLAWCEENGLPMRGHCVYWGIEKYVQDWIKQLPDDQLEARMRQRLDHVTSLFKGRITEWDLNNEMMHGDHYTKRLGWKNGATYFRWAVAGDPTVRWFVNDYDVLQSGKLDKAKAYVRHIRALQADGARVDGIGDQAHFARPLPDTATLWAIFDELGTLGLPVVITEYDQAWKGMTEDEQAEALRRFVTVCFAHPAVRGIYLWGFWEGRHWREGCGLWRKDWTIKPNGQAWVDLLTRTWHSEGEATVTAGAIRFRGFPGCYRLEWEGGAATANLPMPAFGPAAP